MAHGQKGETERDWHSGSACFALRPNDDVGIDGWTREEEEEEDGAMNVRVGGHRHRKRGRVPPNDQND